MAGGWLVYPANTFSFGSRIRSVSGWRDGRLIFFLFPGFHFSVSDISLGRMVSGLSGIFGFPRCLIVYEHLSLFSDVEVGIVRASG